MSLYITIPASFLLGTFGWSFAEYAMHNWRGHGGKGRNEFSREHLAHHSDTEYFAPTYKKVRAATVVAVLMVGAGVLAVGLVHALVFTFGFLMAYAGYETLHRRIHTHPPTGFYGRWARKHHYYHHFSRPNLNHGVTSPIWDVVFRTHASPEQVRVPEKKAMCWLLDPETGDVKAEFSADYVLAKRGGRRKRAKSTAPKGTEAQIALNHA